MAMHLRAALCLGMISIWATWTAGVVQADPPQYCRDLAMQYATAPDQLDANTLAVLRSCEVAESQQQPDTTRPAPPSAQQPDSPGATPIDQPGWGQWSAPPAWSDDKIKTTPWGN
jgi:hypothetical protein